MWGETLTRLDSLGLVWTGLDVRDASDWDGVPFLPLEVVDDELSNFEIFHFCPKSCGLEDNGEAGILKGRKIGEFGRQRVVGVNASSSFWNGCSIPDHIYSISTIMQEENVGFAIS
jgi:hypothetical protein